ncbi:MAG TPA: GNAT family N-acetyltransferase [Gammaproteobacteria bacterium]|jgi:GNAT superfamily N-acetyltransferase
MTAETIPDAYNLLRDFLLHDEYYLESSEVYGHRGEEAIRGALELFLARPELGFVWLAYEDDKPVAVCMVCFAISTSTGSLVAKLDDVYVIDEKQGQGVGSYLISSLKRELVDMDIRRIDSSVHHKNKDAERFYRRNGFRFLQEERLSCVLG